VRPSVFLKVLSVIIIFVFIFFIFNKRARNHLFPYFSTRCLEYKQKDFSRKLHDRVVDYSAEAKRKGIKACKDDRDLKNRISEGKLVRVKSENRYLVDRMTYSSPYVTKESKILLEEIARRFREKVSQKGLNGAKLIVTSMTRKSENVKSLKKSNSNSSENSPHLYGNAFDITYKRFVVRKWILTNCDRKYLKDALGEVIWQLREEKKCFATYERMQNCFHVVTR
jgi:uncharacterized protein YcbK (DUF882 family)